MQQEGLETLLAFILFLKNFHRSFSIQWTFLSCSGSLLPNKQGCRCYRRGAVWGFMETPFSGPGAILRKFWATFSLFFWGTAPLLIHTWTVITFGWFQKNPWWFLANQKSGDLNFLDSQNLRLALVRHVESRHVAPLSKGWMAPREGPQGVRILLVDRCKAWGCCFFFEGSN